MVFLIAALAAVAIAAVIAWLSFTMVKNWIGANQIRDKNYVNVVFKEKLESGSYKTVAGVFNFTRKEISVATAWESKHIDSELEELDRISVIRD